MTLRDLMVKYLTALSKSKVSASVYLHNLTLSFHYLSSELLFLQSRLTFERNSFED